MRQKRFYLRPEFWIGLIVLIGGAIHLLHKFDVSLTAILENYWPVIFIITGIFQISSSRYRDTTSTVLLILVGTALLLFKNGIVTPETVKEHWPDSFRSLLNTILNLGNYLTYLWG